MSDTFPLPSDGRSGNGEDRGRPWTLSMPLDSSGDNSPRKSILKRSNTPDPYQSPTYNRTQPLPYRDLERRVSFSSSRHVRVYGKDEMPSSPHHITTQQRILLPSSSSNTERGAPPDDQDLMSIFEAMPSPSARVDNAFLARLESSPMDRRKRRPDLFGSPPGQRAAKRNAYLSSPQRHQSMMSRGLRADEDDEDDDDNDSDGDVRKYINFERAGHLFDDIDDEAPPPAASSSSNAASAASAAALSSSPHASALPSSPMTRQPLATLSSRPATATTREPLAAIDVTDENEPPSTDDRGPAAADITGITELTENDDATPLSPPRVEHVHDASPVAPVSPAAPALPADNRSPPPMFRTNKPVVVDSQGDTQLSTQLQTQSQTQSQSQSQSQSPSQSPSRRMHRFAQDQQPSLLSLMQPPGSPRNAVSNLAHLRAATRVSMLSLPDTSHSVTMQMTQVMDHDARRRTRDLLGTEGWTAHQDTKGVHRTTGQPAEDEENEEPEEEQEAIEAIEAIEEPLSPLTASQPSSLPLPNAAVRASSSLSSSGPHTPVESPPITASPGSARLSTHHHTSTPRDRHHLHHAPPSPLAALATPTRSPQPSPRRPSTFTFSPSQRLTQRENTENAQNAQNAPASTLAGLDLDDDDADDDEPQALSALHASPLWASVSPGRHLQRRPEPHSMHTSRTSPRPPATLSGLEAMAPSPIPPHIMPVPVYSPARAFHLHDSLAESDRARNAALLTTSSSSAHRASLSSPRPRPRSAASSPGSVYMDATDHSIASDYGDRMMSSSHDIFAVEQPDLYDSGAEDTPNMTLTDFLQYVGILFPDQDIPTFHAPVAGALANAPVHPEDQALASAVTLPELKMYQQLVSEMKQSIDAHQRHLQRVDDDIRENNPAFFSEYMEGEAVARQEVEARFFSIRELTQMQAHKAWMKAQITRLDAFHNYITQKSDELAKDRFLIKHVLAYIKDRMPDLLTYQHELKRTTKELQVRERDYSAEDRTLVARWEKDIKDQEMVLTTSRREVKKQEKVAGEMNARLQKLQIRKKELKQAIEQAQATIDAHPYVSERDLADAKFNYDLCTTLCGLQLIDKTEHTIKMTVLNALDVEIDFAKLRSHQNDAVLIRMLDDKAREAGHFAELVHGLQLMARDLWKPDDIVRKIAIYWNRVLLIQREIQNVQRRFWMKIKPLRPESQATTAAAPSPPPSPPSRGVHCEITVFSYPHNLKFFITFNICAKQVMAFPYSLDTDTLHVRYFNGPSSQAYIQQVIMDQIKLKGITDFIGSIQSVINEIPIPASSCSS